MAGIKNRKEYSYEENHKEVKGIIYKKCSIHKELYSAEDEWFPCTLEYFYKNDKNKIDGLHPNCKKCAIKKATQWKKGQTEEYKKELSEKHKEIVKRDYKIDKNGIRTIIRAMGKIQRESGYQAQWRRDHPEKLKIYNSLHRIHGITKTEEEAILRIFNYSCAYCGLTEKEQLIKFKQKLHNDHVDDDGYNDLLK